MIGYVAGWQAGETRDCGDICHSRSDDTLTIHTWDIGGQDLVGARVYIGRSSESTPWVERDAALKEAAALRARVIELEAQLERVRAALRGQE